MKIPILAMVLLPLSLVTNGAPTAPNSTHLLFKLNILVDANDSKDQVQGTVSHA